MNNAPYHVQEDYPEDNFCSQCGAANILHGYNTVLCHDCRQEFIKYPVPLLIKLFAAGVLIILIYCFYTFPTHLSVGLNIERGKKAALQKKFVTAQKEFAKAATQLPYDIELQCRLALAAFNNMDLSSFSVIAEKLAGKTISNDRMFKKVEEAMKRFKSYMPGDSMIELMKLHGNNIPDNSFRTYLQKHPDDIYAHFSYASILFDRNQFHQCDTVLQKILKRDKSYFPALRLMASLKREMNEFENADKYCDQLLNINSEAGYAIASKARTKLKQNKDEEALQLALKSVATDENDPYNKATLILAYHYNGEIIKRDALIEECRTDKTEASKEFVAYVSDVINGKVPFRNK